MPKNNILILSLRWNIIWDSVREISLAKKIINGNKKALIYYPCSKIIYNLLQENKYLIPIYVPELDNISNSNKNIIYKIYKIIIASIKILYNTKKIDVTVYSWSNNILRQFLSKTISLIKLSKYKRFWFEYWMLFNTELFFTEEEENSIKKYLKNNWKKNISICVESTDRKRMWSKNNFIELIEKLEKNYNIYLLWIDKKYNSKIYKHFWNKIINLVWKLDIRESSLIIKNSYFFIWNDSWLAHIASAVNTNIIIITIENTIKKDMIFNQKIKKEILKNPKKENIINKIK
jgi:hypothetical protein